MSGSTSNPSKVESAVQQASNILNVRPKTSKIDSRNIQNQKDEMCKFRTVANLMEYNQTTIDPINMRQRHNFPSHFSSSYEEFIANGNKKFTMDSQISRNMIGNKTAVLKNES